MPTVAELNDAAPDTPVFVLFLYSRACSTGRAWRPWDSPPRPRPPAGGRFEFVDGGAILHAEPSPTILYKAVARLPQSRPRSRSTRPGICSASSTASASPAWWTRAAAATSTRGLPGAEELAGRGRIPLRLSMYLFAQKAGDGAAGLTRSGRPGSSSTSTGRRPAGRVVLEGAGENLVGSAGDFENFLAPRPELAERMERELRAVTRQLVRNRWPIRIHATYDETITRVLDVFEEVFRETRSRAAGSSTTRRQSPPQTSRASRRSAAGSRSRTGWPSPASCSRSGTARRPLHPPRRCGRLLEPASPSGRERT